MAEVIPVFHYPVDNAVVCVDSEKGWWLVEEGKWGETGETGVTRKGSLGTYPL